MTRWRVYGWNALIAALWACASDPSPRPPAGDSPAPGDALFDHCAAAPMGFMPAPPATGYMGQDVIYPPENPYSWEKAILGKILFWEEQMSSDDTVACGTCHQPAAGGSDGRAADPLSAHPGPDGSVGTADDIHGGRGVRRCTDTAGAISYIGDPVFGPAAQVTKRKPPTYLDAMFSFDLFWDGRATNAFTDPDTMTVAIATGGALESQAVGPPLSDSEMACEGRTWPDIHAKLAVVTPLRFASNFPPDVSFALCNNPTYPDLFNAAYGDPTINTQRIAFAIATHERTLVSNQTPYDLFLAGDNGALTMDQQEGMNVLLGGAGLCQRCHFAPHLGSSIFSNLGLVNADFDTGRQEVTTMAAHRGQFKVPTMRNTGLREAGGLLHDGIGDGASLEDLMDAYNNPPALDSNTDPRMAPTTALGLTPDELDKTVDFMRNGLTDPRVANEQFPFDRPRLGSE